MNLHRFIEAQDHDGTYERALRELEAGRKESHWMWFVFPQAAGLSASEKGRLYAITGLEEARAYLDHPVLGQRLKLATAILLTLPDLDRAFGPIDLLKLHASMTLFWHAAPRPNSFFELVLDRYFESKTELRTSDILLIWQPHTDPTKGSGNSEHRRD